MIIGVPKEIKNNEDRVALTPGGAFALVQAGHSVIVQSRAGVGSGYEDETYVLAGAKIAETADEVWEKAAMILKVKEPLPAEYRYFHEGLILFTYLHLAADPELARVLLEKRVTAIAYETVESNRTLPLLTPMSEVAGRMAAQIGAHLLQKPMGGPGILLSGVPGVKRGKVTIIGGGVVGTNAAKIVCGLGAEVTILDVSPDRLRQLDDIFRSEVSTLISDPFHIAEAVTSSDLVIGAVLIPGAKAPVLVTKEMVCSMKPGSVIIDVAIDQGGIVETADRVTTHDEPTYVKFGIVHYAVANMPGAVPRTSTMALTNSTMPFVMQMADKGVKKAVMQNPALKLGVNMTDGHCVHPTVAKALGYEPSSVDQIWSDY